MEASPLDCSIAAGAAAEVGAIAARVLVDPPEPERATCPCCGQPVDVPSVGTLVHRLDLSVHEAAVLRTIWNDRARAVSAAASFDLMCADDIDGGPSEGTMAKRFNSALTSLRAKLSGSGVGIETNERGRHRLVLSGTAP